MVQFGADFAVNILGVSTISQPPEVGPDEALVYLELAMKLSLRPSDGVFSMEAQLTPNSFVLVKACKVTGGFAFYLWFKDDPKRGITAGDFVLTVGGYSPRFKKPDFYPPVPILGFNWPVAEGLNVGGGAYLALTPSAFMVGGFLKATFEAGPIQAWFDANADFLISWQPFYFVADISISVGVAVDIDLAGVHMRLSASLGASLHLEGPPVHGTVHVSWYVISFTIPFGDGPKPNDKTLTWGDFEASFLPPPQQPKQAPRSTAARTAPAAAALDDPPPLQQVVKATSQIALLANTTDDQGDDWTISTAPISIRVQTAVPMTKASVSTGPSYAGVDIGVPPCGQTTVTTPLTLTLKYEDSHGNYQPVNLADFPGLGFSDGRAGAPEAMWSKQLFDPDGTPSANLVQNALTAVVMAGDEYVVGSEIGPIDLLGAFEFSDAPNLPLAFDQMPVYTPAAPMQQGTFEQVMATIGATIMSTDGNDDVVGTRNAIFAALTDAGLYTPQNPDLSVMARFAASLFQAPPILAALSETLAAVPGPAMGRVTATQPAPAMRAAARTGPAPGDHPLMELGTLSRYRRAGRPRVRGATAMAKAPREAQLYLDLAHNQPNPKMADGQRRIRLHDGGYALWQVPSTADAQVTPDPGTPVRVIAFDAYTDLLDDRVLPVGQATRLPAGTALVALQHAGHLAPDASQIVGWTRRTELLQANRVRFVGDGFTVRPHDEPRRRRRGRMQRHGTMDAATMLHRNRTRHGAGWVETTFQPAMRTVIVTVLGGAAAARASTDVQLRTPGAATPYARLEPAAAIEIDGMTLLAYALPATPSGVLRHVLVRCAGELEGCHAWTGSATELGAALPGLEPLVGGMVIGGEPTAAIAWLSVELHSNRAQVP
jgi:hypothetical protein